MMNFKQKILNYYSLSEVDYENLTKDVTISDLPNPFKYENMEGCVSFIKKQIELNKKILIYGDYDCDGVMATSIVFLALKTDTFTPGFYIPFRETDGYGLTKENIKKFSELGYEVLILVDNGITLNDEIDYANSLGLTVIIFDHHTMEEKLPNALFILHPIYSGFSEYNMCAGSLAFFFSMAYLGKVDEYLLTLAMISTISDLMEIKGYNRLLIKLGLKSLNTKKYSNIFQLINKDLIKITETDIAILVAPKINAIGRIINDNSLFNIVRYFIKTDDANFTRDLAEWITDVNTHRKQLIKENNENLNFDNNKNSIVFEADNLKEGLTGLLAAKILDEYNKPVVVLTKSSKDEKILKGSIRSKSGFDVNIILNDLKDLLIAYGGHQNAGGLTLEDKNFQEFMKRFDFAASKHHFVDEKTDMIEINITDINKENYDFLMTLSPFGQGFKKPVFLIKNVKTTFLTKSKDNKHIIFKVNPTSAIVYFNFDKKIFDNNYVDLYGNLDINYFNNYTTTQFHVSGFLKNILE